MRPVRFVALSEDGQAFVLADEVGRLLALPIDDRVATALRLERAAGSTVPASADTTSSLSPRDIQARIRAGESADDVARVAGVPVDRVLRYAGPVLQERAMLAQHARRTKLRTSAKGATLAEIVDGRLGQHGIDAEKISWDAYRRDDGTWRIVATWPSGKATAQAIWELDKARQQVTPHDDMAQYLCTDRVGGAPSEAPALPGRGDPVHQHRGEPTRSGHEPMRPAAETARREPIRPVRPTGGGRGLTGDPIRAGRDALLASLERPLGAPRDAQPAVSDAPAASAGPAEPRRARGAAALIGSAPGSGAGSAFEDDPDAPVREVPAVPSLAVLRPRLKSQPENTGSGAGGGGERPRKRLPSWDDVLFGSAPAARESS
jgi:hypothetical protein